MSVGYGVRVGVKRGVGVVARSLENRETERGSESW